MTMNINLKLYILLLTIFLIFNLSCEDADYPTIFEDNNTYTLVLQTSVSGGDIDYNDGGAFESTIVTATLSQVSSEGTPSPKSGAEINCNTTLGSTYDPSNLPSFDNLIKDCQYPC